MASAYVGFAVFLFLVAVSATESEYWTSTNNFDVVYFAPSERRTLPKAQTETVFLTQKAKTYVKAGKFFIPMKDLPNETFADEVDTMKKQGPYRPNSWTEVSCCRRRINLRTRSRINGGYLNVQRVPCTLNFCSRCEDKWNNCYNFARYCYRGNQRSPFLVRFCPRTCGWCYSQATQPPTTPPAPSMVRVNVYSKTHSNPRLYKFSTRQMYYGYQYQTGQYGDISYFYMYPRPYGAYIKPYYFCSNYQSTADFISTTGCTNGFRKFALYGADKPSGESKFLIVSTISSPVVASRIARTTPCCGYTKMDWIFFVPDYSREVPRPPPTTTTSYNPFNFITNPTTTTPLNLFNRFTPPAPNTTPFNPFVPNPPTPPPPTPPVVPPPVNTVAPPQFQLSPFNRECLEYHNYFRALHNTPALTWDPSLATSSQRWANFLITNAPGSPSQANPAVKTPNWPHSRGGTIYRGNNVGENILWSVSQSKATGGMSTLLWYAEIFDYNKNTPTQGRNGRPVGHYTQLLWKGTTKIGCSIATANINFGGAGISSYVVAQYSPAGNVIGFASANVMDPRDSCECNQQFSNLGACMGYGPQKSCRCFGTPTCGGNGGCIASCPRPTGLIRYRWEGACRGTSSCKCTNTPVNNMIGAVCS